MMAMGMALNYEWFKFNPNYFCALGTKENYACGFAAMDDPQAGSGGTTVNIQGVDYHWYIVLPSTDGPFQQEEPNFIGVARIFPDYFSSENDYEKYVYVSDAPNDPQWASAVINSALSNVATRETLWAFQRGEYGRIVFDAKDPMAELGVITFTYNRGIGAFCGTGVMGNLDAFVASDDTISDFGLIGFAEHVPSIKAITMAMNAETENVYDEKILWSDVTDFMTMMRRFYGRGYPSDGEWNAMLDDLKIAFDALAVHWGGDYISYRYDFLTLLRVFKHHLKTPTIPRPTTYYWRFLIDGGWLSACVV
jgi:hypothetical protein